MKLLLKIIISFVIAVILISSTYFVFFLEVEDEDNTSDINGDDTTDGGNGDDGNSGNGDDSDTDQGYIHTVFIEEGTAGWCVNCPAVADILHDLYTSGDYRFYYVSLVHDENTEAQERLEEDYNIYGFPTVFIDGGYEVVVGEQDKSVFEDRISAAASRETPELHLEVNAEWDETTEELETTVIVENNEDETYTGHLKVYLTEKISRWYDYDGTPYHFGFLNYIINEDITISSKGSTSTSETWPASSLDPDNLMVVAVIFNSESTTKYSDPPDNNHAFNAFYADATNGTEVVEGGNLPPEVGIELPKKLRVHLFGTPRRMTPLRKNTVLIGRTTVKVYASDDSAIDKVEFYIDGKLRETIEEAPYEWTFRKVKLVKRIVRRHTITVVAYDDTGKTSSVNLDVITFLL